MIINGKDSFLFIFSFLIGKFVQVNYVFMQTGKIYIIQTKIIAG